MVIDREKAPILSQIESEQTLGSFDYYSGIGAGGATVAIGILGMLTVSEALKDATRFTVQLGIVFFMVSSLKGMYRFHRSDVLKEKYKKTLC